MALVFHTIEYEEIPLADQHLHPLSIRPSSVYERDDPRSIIYVIQDEPNMSGSIDDYDGFDLAAAVAAAAAERRQQQQQRIQQARQAEAMRRLESVMEDEAILNAIGRRILAINGYDVPEPWQHFHRRPQYQHLHQHQHHHHRHSSPASVQSEWAYLPPQYHQQLPRGYGYSSRAYPHVFSASSLQLPGPSSGRTAWQGDEDADEYDQGQDEVDIDWLGSELLSRERGAPVWILDAHRTAESRDKAATPSFEVIEYDDDDADDMGSVPGRHFGMRDIQELTTELAAQPPRPGEAAADAAAAGISPLATSTSESDAAVSRRSTSDDTASGQPQRARSRSRAATVMSESEEEELETVGRVETEDDAAAAAAAAPVAAGGSGAADRPKKAVKVVDTRTGNA
ncbi:uncharacterized protein PFL1_06564 [Pseudozyma flocculosa PF-1]|uniref:Uncharacterized protein n=2 Tax=Pseudozyma flocculosa TaxID=84751 RepID=A0A5C3FB90_9BASI|nr:uncharacterized protein PFL1_06564 [Pseudozyma flocculosa PF-1]EPQ25890.1 hypothetical protein PFL1_06564 [Pseudozyma flocculosa PF-1]SPO40609.1 uncharacterized protein PSFLO_06091 [Pseudozyma flocculosa]